MMSLSKGWAMIFKAVKGVTVPLVGDLWNSSSSQSENTMAALDTTTTHRAHYKNCIVQEWETFNPAQVINWKEKDCLKRQQQQQQKHEQYKYKQTNKPKFFIQASSAYLFFQFHQGFKDHSFASSN